MVLSINAAYCQNTDDLKGKLRTATSDTERHRVYSTLINHYEFSNYDSATFYAKQGLSAFTVTRYKLGMASMLAWQSQLDANEGMLDLAKKSAEEAQVIYREISNEAGIANTHNLLGMIQGRKCNYTDATQHFLQALQIYEKLNDNKGIIATYLKLGAVNTYTNDLDKALEYYRKGLELPDNDVTNKIFFYSNIASVYTRKQDYKSAMTYIQKALQYSKAPQYARLTISPLTIMGILYQETGKTDKALEVYQQALEIAEREKMPQECAELLINISQSIKQFNTGKALHLLEDALSKAKEIGQRQLQSEALAGMIEIYRDDGKYQEAYTLLEQKNRILDSIFNSDKIRTIAGLESGYELDKLNTKVQRLELSEQKEKQKKKGFIIIAIVLTAGFLVDIYFLWKTKKLNYALIQREMQLKTANSVKDKLFSIIGHDLIGPIGYMPVVIGLCRDTTMPAEERESFLGLVEKNAIACFETLENLLNWGKSQMQGISINQVNVNVNEIAAKELQLIIIYANSKNINIINNISPDTCVFADPNHVKFIIRNLLSNAVKYSAKSGTVTIDAKKTENGEHVLFSVKDEGIGISAEKRGKIFESFGVSSPGTANERGNGIGLQLCKEFVIENGGKIWVESEQNKGSVFYFTLKTGKLS